ncbi:MAG: PEP-CTERM sorting domain-containing protein [Verrucomicrobia bacterium]|nr:PEP-CTERM sorting domain-containing protein [Verrucomicrobiota bacterium]
MLTNTSSITYSEAILTYDVIALRKRSGTQDRSLTLNFGVFDAGEGSVGAATNPVPTASVNLSPMAEGSTVQVNATIASISWAPGQELWLRWNFPNQANQHHVGGINNLTVIPEPSTYAAIFGLVMLGFVAWRRRR